MVKLLHEVAHQHTRGLMYHIRTNCNRRDIRILDDTPPKLCTWRQRAKPTKHSSRGKIVLRGEMGIAMEEALLDGRSLQLPRNTTYADLTALVAYRDDDINGLGTGYGEAAWGGTGVTTINNVTGIDLGSFSSGTTTANLADNENSTVNLAAGFGASVINLGKSTLGTNTTTFNLHGITADQISSVVSGSALTMTIAGSSLTINNYQPGSLNFIYGNDYSTASATPPGLAQVAPS